MQVTTGIDAKHSKEEIEQGLSKVLLETHLARLQTRDFERRLKGPMCRTLRLLLVEQHNELRGAETELGRRTRELRRPARGVRRPLEASSSALSDDTIEAVDERIMCLVQAHERAARSVRRARGLSEEARDLRTCALLARQTDVHEKAAWMLASMYVASLVSCELCSARFKCPLSAVRLPATMTAGGAESPVSAGTDVEAQVRR